MTHTWRSLNAILHTLPEKEVLVLLQREKEGDNRRVMLTRLHQRYSLLRMTRERAELFEE
jgi:hypothetical protein